MTNPEKPKPDFTDALEMQEKIIGAERFWYGGDPRGVGRDASMRKKEIARTAFIQRPNGSGRAVGKIDRTALRATGLYRDDQEQ